MDTEIELEEDLDEELDEEMGLDWFESQFGPYTYADEEMEPEEESEELDDGTRIRFCAPAGQPGELLAYLGVDPRNKKALQCLECCLQDIFCGCAPGMETYESVAGYFPSTRGRWSNSAKGPCSGPKRSGPRGGKRSSPG